MITVKEAKQNYALVEIDETTIWDLRKATQETYDFVCRKYYEATTDEERQERKEVCEMYKRHLENLEELRKVYGGESKTNMIGKII